MGSARGLARRGRRRLRGRQRRAHQRRAETTTSIFARVIVVPRLRLFVAADDGRRCKQLLLPGALRVVVVNEFELAVAELEDGHVGGRADAQRSQFLEPALPRAPHWPSPSR